MGVGRLLIIGAIAWLAWFVYRRFRLRLETQALKTKVAKSKKDKLVTAFKQCVVCSMHVPENEAVERNGLIYCSEAHANQ